MLEVKGKLSLDFAEDIYIHIFLVTFNITSPF